MHTRISSPHSPRHQDSNRHLHALDPDTTQSPEMGTVLATARRVAASDSSLLVQGETGTGKEWLARAIHDESPRADEPFVAVNCAALSETLLESQLFGHERGAFTGADRRRRGFFERAHRGTLFLDEIGDMPLSLQSKLLRAVEERSVLRVGGERSIPIDVRVMTATHRDLPAGTRDQTFRADLYYRLAVVELELPPLRRRRADLAALVDTFTERHRKRLARWSITGLTRPALEAIHAYDWPGNVRELVNVIERAMLLSDGPEIEERDLPPAVLGQPTSKPPRFPTSLMERRFPEGRRALLEAFERAYFGRLLHDTGGRMGETAERAGINVRTVREKLNALGIDRQTFRGV